MSLVWLEPAHTPFGCSVFDTREIATQMRSTSKDSRTAATFLAMRNSNGADLRELLPTEGLAVPCDLSYPLHELPIDGPLFKASRMEEKWDIYLWGGAIYFTRSWTGSLAFVAHLSEARDRFHVERITADRQVTGESPHLARRQVDFILRAHYYDQQIPHPLPDELPEDASAIVNYSFAMYGARGLYATYEDTTEILREELTPPSVP
jgi:hypothetical protein